MHAGLDFNFDLVCTVDYCNTAPLVKKKNELFTRIAAAGLPPSLDRGPVQ